MFKKTGLITVNGKNYSDFNSLPDMVQKLFSDADGNGIPDVFEGKIGNMLFKNLEGLRTFDVDGKTYNSFQDMPPEIRQRVEEKLKNLTGMNLGSQFQWSKEKALGWEQAYHDSRSPQNKLIWFIVGMGLTFVLILGAAAATFFFLMR